MKTGSGEPDSATGLGVRLDDTWRRRALLYRNYIVKAWAPSGFLGVCLRGTSYKRSIWSEDDCCWSCSCWRACESRSRIVSQEALAALQGAGTRHDCLEVVKSWTQGRKFVSPRRLLPRRVHIVGLSSGPRAQSAPQWPVSQVAIAGHVHQDKSSLSQSPVPCRKTHLQFRS